MSYGATVGASAANSNVIKFKKNIFLNHVLNKPNIHFDFLKWFIDDLKKNANKFRLCVFGCRYLAFT